MIITNWSCLGESEPAEVTINLCPDFQRATYYRIRCEMRWAERKATAN